MAAAWPTAAAAEREARRRYWPEAVARRQDAARSLIKSQSETNKPGAKTKRTAGVEAQGRGRDVQAGAGLDAAVTKGLARLILRAVANGLNVVAVRVKDIAAEVVGVVPRTKTGRAVIAATCGEGRGVERFDGRAVW